MLPDSGTPQANDDQQARDHEQSAMRDAQHPGKENDHRRKQAERDDSDGPDMKDLGA